MGSLASRGDFIIMHTTVPGTPRKPTNVTLDEALLIEAKALRITVSHAAEVGLVTMLSLARAVSERHVAQWLEENLGALESSSAYVEQHGLPLADYRKF